MSCSCFRARMRANLTNFTLLTLLAPTVAAIAAGDTTEKAWAGAGGFVVNIVDSGGQGRRLRRPQVSCSCFRSTGNLTIEPIYRSVGILRYRGGYKHLLVRSAVTFRQDI